MKDLTPISLVILLLAMASGRWLARRHLGSLTVEQKALVLETSSRGNIWPLGFLAVGVGLFFWLLPGRIPLPYFVGFSAAFILTLFLASVGAAATSVIRLSRAGLPQSYVRSVAVRAILFFAALLLLLSALISSFSAYAKGREQGARSSNQSMKLTAGSSAINV